MNKKCKRFFRGSVIMILCLSLVMGLMVPMQVEAAASVGSISGSITNNVLAAPLVQKDSTYLNGTRSFGWGHNGINNVGAHDFYMSFGFDESTFSGDQNGHYRYHVTIDAAYPVYTATYAYAVSGLLTYRTYYVSKYPFNVQVFNLQLKDVSSRSLSDFYFQGGPAVINYLGGESYYLYSFYSRYRPTISSFPVRLLGVYNPHLEVFDTKADFESYLSEIGVPESNYIDYCLSKDIHALCEVLDNLGQIGGSGSGSGSSSGGEGGGSGSSTEPSDQGWLDRILNLIIDLPLDIATALRDTELGKFVFRIPDEIVKLFIESDLGQYIMKVPVEIYQQFRQDGIFSVIESLADDITTKINDSKLGRFLFGVPITIAKAIEDSPLGEAIKDMYEKVKLFFNADGPAEAILAMRDILFGIPVDIFDGFSRFSNDILEGISGLSFVQTVIDSSNDLIDFLLNPLAAFGLDRNFIFDLIRFFADPFGVFGFNDKGHNFVQEAIQDAWNALVQPMVDLMIDLIVPDHNVLQEYIDVLSSRFPFIDSCRDAVELVLTRLRDVADDGVIVPKINIPLSATFLSEYDVSDHVIDFSWFLPYRAGVLMFERGALCLMFVFRFYFSIKSVFTAASNSASAISTMYHNITYNP